MLPCVKGSACPDRASRLNVGVRRAQPIRFDRIPAVQGHGASDKGVVHRVLGVGDSRIAGRLGTVPVQQAGLMVTTQQRKGGAAHQLEPWPFRDDVPGQ